MSLFSAPMPAIEVGKKIAGYKEPTHRVTRGDAILGFVQQSLTDGTWRAMTWGVLSLPVETQEEATEWLKNQTPKSLEHLGVRE